MFTPKLPLRHSLSLRLGWALGVSLVLTACAGRLPDSLGADLNLWETIAATERQAPFSASGVEMALQVPLELYTDRSNELFAFYRAPVLTLRDGVVVSKVDLRVRKGTPKPGLLVLDTSGTCVSLANVQARFSPLEIVGTPRGHSLSEQTVWAASRTWGRLSFGYTEQNPGCLATVIFTPDGSA